MIYEIMKFRILSVNEYVPVTKAPLHYSETAKS